MTMSKNAVAQGLFVLSLLGVTACDSSTNTSPSVSGNASNQSSEVEADFRGNPSTFEVIKMKYDKAELKCAVNFQIQVGPVNDNRVSAQQAQMSWDLLNDYSDKKVLSGEVQADGVVLKVNLDLNKVRIEHSEVNERSRRERFHLRYSPVVSGSFKFETSRQIVMGNHIYVQPSGSGTISFYENVERNVIDKAVTSQAEDSMSVSHYEIHMNCVLDSQLKDRYRNQFSKVSY